MCSINAEVDLVSKIRRLPQLLSNRSSVGLLIFIDTFLMMHGSYSLLRMPGILFAEVTTIIEVLVKVRNRWLPGSIRIPTLPPLRRIQAWGLVPI
jgi:hypothetical protein